MKRFIRNTADFIRLAGILAALAFLVLPAAIVIRLIEGKVPDHGRY